MELPFDDEEPKQLEFVSTPKHSFVENPLRPIAFEVTHPLLEEAPKRIDIHKYLDVALFTTLLIAGLTLTFTLAGGKSAEELLGSLFFNGGMPPFIVSAWAVSTGATVFRKRNAIKSVVSMVLLVLGFILIQSVATGDSVWELLGVALFEVGALFFVSKFFFLVEDTELQVEKLAKQLEEALKSPGYGMALSYFYNFILPTAANLDKGSTAIDMEIKRGEFQEYQLDQSYLLIVVPRDLDGSDMKAFLRTISMEKKVMQGKPKEKPGKGTHRPMFVYFMEWNETEKTCNALFDIPTIISSCYDRMKDVESYTIDITKEILDFQNRLVELVAENSITKDRVRIVSIPSTPFNFEFVKKAAQEVLARPHSPMELADKKKSKGFLDLL